MVLEQSIATTFHEFQFQVVVEMRYRALVVMALSAQLHPEIFPFLPATPEVHALVDRTVDVAGPETSEPPLGMGMLRRGALELQVDVMRFLEGELRNALHEKMRNGLLRQLGGTFVFLGEGHRGLAGLKEYLPVQELGFPIEVVLQIESRVSRNEQVPLAAFVTQAPNAVVSRPMLAMSRIISDDGFQVPDFEGGVSHLERRNAINGYASPLDEGKS